MIRLPDVTLVVADSVAQPLSRMAIEDTLRQIEPAAVLTWGNEELVPYAEHTFAPLRSYEEVGEVLWHEAPKKTQTSHMLLIQYDGWVLDGTAWTDEFLDYDYIGAPWFWYDPPRNVGNGGFSLRSVELMKATGGFVPGFPEDERLCRGVYRNHLEPLGFKWAPAVVASKFSFERVQALPKKTFGFHGMFNWPYLLSREALASRRAAATDYVRSKVEWREMV